MPSEPSRIPQMPAGILLDARDATADGGAAIGGGTAFSPDANSENEPSGFHSWEPSTCTELWALTRFSAIQRRISSTLTGPYGRPSVPMILYITCLSCFSCRQENFRMVSAVGRANPPSVAEWILVQPARPLLPDATN